VWFAETPLTDDVRRCVLERWGIGVAGPGERLVGGEESASYRVGDRVIRIGPEWRSTAELEWAYGVAAQAAVGVREVAAPVPTTGGSYVVRVGGRPVSVWPFVEGSWADAGDDAYRVQAAELLARVHRHLVSVSVPPRPAHAGMERGRHQTRPEVADPELDQWLSTFMVRRRRRQLLHADFYRGNVLVRNGRIVALLDWDDVFFGPPEQELAWAAWEWGGGLDTLDLAPAMLFIDRYVAAGGVADRIEDEEFVQLVRDRIRMEVNYSYAAGQWGTCTDPEELTFMANRFHAFRTLRP
jgi:Ser/Thr protein kinase RdoA (MazF antagonist)